MLTYTFEKGNWSLYLCVFKQSACEEDRSPCGDKGVCIPIYKKNSVRCNCDDGYIGIPCSK